jgi:N-glycosidase YbiA
MTIDSFSGKFDFLSNFYGEGLTVEHYYQAAKTWHDDWKQSILNAETPGRAKRLGRKAPMRDDWDEVRVDIMYELLKEKFQDLTLAIKLIDTFPISLIEGNKWHDNFWGICSCMKCRNTESHNMLGFLLMRVRGELMAETFKK